MRVPAGATMLAFALISIFLLFAALPIVEARTFNYDWYGAGFTDPVFSEPRHHV